MGYANIPCAICGSGDGYATSDGTIIHGHFGSTFDLTAMVLCSDELELPEGDICDACIERHVAEGHLEIAADLEGTRAGLSERALATMFWNAAHKARKNIRDVTGDFPRASHDGSTDLSAAIAAAEIVHGYPRETEPELAGRIHVAASLGVGRPCDDAEIDAASKAWARKIQEKRDHDAELLRFMEEEIEAM